MESMAKAYLSSNEEKWICMKLKSRIILELKFLSIRKVIILWFLQRDSACINTSFHTFFFIERSPLRNIFMLSLFHHSAKLAQTLKETRWIISLNTNYIWIMHKREEKALIINSKQLLRYSTQDKLSGTAVERCNMLERHAGDNERTEMCANDLCFN